MALELSAGQLLKIIDTEGQQVADLVAFARGDPTRWLSSGRSFDYNGTLSMTTGHVLYANTSEPMLTLQEDAVGRHDFLYTPCSREMFRIQHDQEDQPGCLEHLAAALEPHGVPPHAIPTPFNVFMNVAIGDDGTLSVLAPLSQPGDALVLRAEMDLIVGVSACSAASCCAGRCKPIDLEVHQA